ncbi:wiskott-Aldrich syndrome protein homolog 1-like [Penaeus japonicus]|uniref:wiskott-Aldrich syndrome protein homolog 1-like n=1 Tax=Penaeus japonicus TaxID=27405 RepID=UPI001C715215|nr:wiskott-Aldrich syndrome protein homolog 1-like [Penaeus japonicus]
MVPGGSRPKPIGEESERAARSNPRTPPHIPPDSPTEYRKVPTPRRKYRPLPPLPAGDTERTQLGLGTRKPSAQDVRRLSSSPATSTGTAGGEIGSTSSRGSQTDIVVNVQDARAILQEGPQPPLSQGRVATCNPAYRPLLQTRVSCSQQGSSGRSNAPPPKPPRTFAAAQSVLPRYPVCRSSQSKDSPPLPPRTPVFKPPPTPTAGSQTRPQNALPLPPRSPVWHSAQRNTARQPLPTGRLHAASPPGAEGFPRPPSAHARAGSPSSSSPSPEPLPLPQESLPAARSPSQSVRQPLSSSSSSSDLLAPATANGPATRRSSPGAPRSATLPRWASLLLPGAREPPSRRESTTSSEERKGLPATLSGHEERGRRPKESSRGMRRWPSAPPPVKSSPSPSPRATVTAYTLMVYTDDSTTPPTTSIFLGPPVRR